MADEKSSGKTPLPPEEAVRECLRGELDKIEEFEGSKIKEVSNRCVSEIIKICRTQGQGLQYQYKYVCNVVILEKTGAGLHSTSSCLWDKESDTSLSTTWPRPSDDRYQESKIFAICSVWALRCN